MEGDIWLSGAAYELGEQHLSYDRIQGLEALVISKMIPFLPKVLGLGSYYKTDDVYQVASRSVQKTLAKAGIEASLVDAVIVSAASFRHEFDTQKFGFGRVLLDNSIRPEAFYAMCGTGCVAVLAAIEQARDLIALRRFACVLVVNVDHIVSDDDRARFINYALVSDAAASVLVTNRPGLADLQKLVGISRRVNVDQMLHGIHLNSSDGGPSTIENVLRRAQVVHSGLDKILATNTFLPIKKNRERALGFSPRQLFLDNITRVGHCLGADALVNLVDCEPPVAGQPKLRLMYSEADGHTAAILVSS